jgi:hypothetical protein
MAEHTARFNNWFQIVSNIAIIVGLGLVVYELNQSKTLAHVQFVNDDFARLTDLQMALIGEDPREAFAKASLNPNELTEQDVVALEALYQTVAMNMNNIVISSRRAGLDRPWRLAVSQQASRWFSSEPGRRWLRAYYATIDDRFGLSEVGKVAQRAVVETPDDYYGSMYQLLLAKY